MNLEVKGVKFFNGEFGQAKMGILLEIAGRTVYLIGSEMSLNGIDAFFTGPGNYLKAGE